MCLVDCQILFSSGLYLQCISFSSLEQNSISISIVSGPTYNSFWSGPSNNSYRLIIWTGPSSSFYSFSIFGIISFWSSLVSSRIINISLSGRLFYNFNFESTDFFAFEGSLLFFLNIFGVSFDFSKHVEIGVAK